LVRPGWLFDAAFQLSFAAVAGIIVLTPRLEERLQHKTWWQSGIYRYMAHLVLGSLAAQLAVTPVVAYYFSRITPVALLANPLMVFLAGVSVVAGFAADLAGFLFFPLARVISLLSALTMQWMIYLANLFAGLPWASFEITAPGVVDIAFFWAAAYLGTGLFTSRSRPGSLLIVGLVWINFLLWGGVIESGKDTVLLRFPDLGRKSSAAVVYLPGNATVLVSPAGKTGSVTRRVLSDCILRHSGRKIDCLILRKPGPGQIRWAWEMADRFDLGALVIEPPKKESLLYVNFLEYCKAGNVPVRMASARDTSAVHGAGIYFLPLAGSSSLIPVVERGGLRVLFAGALKTNDLKSFLDSEKSSGFDCDMLEWPLTLEGGQEDKTASGFLGNFKPGLVVSPFACGHAGRVRMMSTEEHGAVTVSFEHGVIRVSTERTGWRGVRTLRFRSCSPG
ncbi:MAG: ComEC/Rec2 family competence protein, partial [Gemmatimonadota bacterium]|nr:ComEC/Rec2 family competence protein [Gemmatimonadota bacterium]